MFDAIYHAFEYFVQDFTKIMIVALELIGLLIIIYSSIMTLTRFVKLKYQQTSTDIRIRLGRGISFALMFYLGAEILRLILIREYKDLFIVGAIIVLHVIVSVLIAWEVSHSLHVMKEERELDHDCTD
ncbi:MAG: DUF1622 domain-containing protein [Erysipelothrix sp.]|nr:DUF1622 domain-containing protein [Erysipelothrix sp.]